MDISKHLIGQHDQKKHGKKGHARDDHAGFWSEQIFEPTKTSREFSEVRREAWHKANDRGLGAINRQNAMVMAAKGHQKVVADREEKERKLSREENGFLKHHLTENTAASVVVGGLMATFVRNPNMAKEWMRFVERSQRVARTNPRIAEPWRNAFKKNDVDPALQSTVKKMFEGEFGGFRSVVDTTTIKRGVVTVHGAVKNASGVQVGGWNRTINRGGEVHHDLLSLQRSAQGSGFSKGFYDQSMKAYRENGFGSVTTLANIDVGGYAWARQGFQFAPGTAWTARAEMMVRSVMARNRSDLYTSRDVAQAQLLSLSPGTRPIDYTRIGRDRSWTDANGIEHWFGKDMMLGSNWFASKAL